MLSRYPFKSFQGEVLEAVELDEKGVPGDRRWALVDQSSGKALSAKREPRLLDATARTEPDGTVVVTLPDDAEYATTDPALEAAARAWLDRDVRVEQASEADARVYEFNISSEDENSMLLDVPCPPGTFLDLAAVHVLSTASLRAIAAEHPEGRWAPPRFRPTILVEDGDDGFMEDGWIGGFVTIGGAVLEPFMPTIRCAMTTRAQLDLPRDLDIAKTVNREHGGSLGIYCKVTQPGRVAVRDAVVPG